MNLPSNLREALLGRVCAEHEPTYLLLDSSYRVARVGADMERYGLAELRIGEPAHTQVRFLQGLLPPRDLPITLPAVEMPSGRIADVLLHGDADGLWVVLLDVTGEIERARLLQQKADGSVRRSERTAPLAQAWPTAATEYLNRLLLEQLHPAFLQVDVDGNLMSGGGALELYGLSGLEAGAAIVDHLPLLMGLLPLQPGSDPFVVPWVNVDGGGYMDVHLLPGDGCDFVICVEALVDRQERVAWQQKGNELTLTKQKQAQLLRSHVGKYVAEELLRGGASPGDGSAHPRSRRLARQDRGRRRFRRVRSDSLRDAGRERAEDDAADSRATRRAGDHARDARLERRAATVRSPGAERRNRHQHRRGRSSAITSTSRRGCRRRRWPVRSSSIPRRSRRSASTRRDLPRGRFS
jgi:hypothetical protein